METIKENKLTNCKDQVVRVYQNLQQQDEQNNNAFEIFPEEEIVKEYALDNFYYICEDYDEKEPASYENRKYKQYDEFDFSSDENIEVFEKPSRITYQEEKEAYENENFEFFCKDENFEKSEVDEYQEIFETWDGSNWNKRFLGSTWEGDSPLLERMEELEKCTYKEILNTKGNQTFGHDVFYEIFDENNNHLMFLKEPISYFQGDNNNIFFEIEKSEIPKEAFEIEE